MAIGTPFPGSLLLPGDQIAVHNYRRTSHPLSNSQRKEPASFSKGFKKKTLLEFNLFASDDLDLGYIPVEAVSTSLKPHELREGKSDSLRRFRVHVTRKRASAY